MMPKKSAGLLAYRMNNGSLEVFLGHPGGPFFSKKDIGVWSIPKGEFENEKPLSAAKREFLEETGFKLKGKFVELTPVRQKSGKIVFAWAIEQDLDPSKLKSNMFTLTFRGSSGPGKEYPEIDRAEWFPIDVAKQKILTYQVPLISELDRLLVGHLG
jgi:predicted NUDIX family NTP pyrophosphohydrolase